MNNCSYKIVVIKFINFLTFFQNGSIDKKDRIYIYTKEPTSFDTEALFPLEGMEDTLNTDQVQSSEEGSDTDGQFNFQFM